MGQQGKKPDELNDSFKTVLHRILQMFLRNI